MLEDSFSYGGKDPRRNRARMADGDSLWIGSALADDILMTRVTKGVAEALDVHAAMSQD